MNGNGQPTLKIPRKYPPFFHIIKEAIPSATKTSIWLLKLTIPVSFGVFLLNITGILSFISGYLAPFFHFLGLPVESALILLTSIFTNIYSVVAVLGTLALPIREATILGIMALISHGFIVETAVLKKTGSSAIRMLILRFMSSLLAGIFLSHFLPAMEGKTSTVAISQSMDFMPALILWLKETLYMTIKIILLISTLMILQKALTEYGIVKYLAILLRPILKIMGLPSSSSLSWIVANTIGLAYGSAVMLEQVSEKRMSKSEADLLNHHVAVSHSQLEDPLLFLAVNVPIIWLIWPRILLAIIVVWLRRFEIYMRNNRQNEK